jgi:hypothetical protein
MNSPEMYCMFEKKKMCLLRVEMFWLQIKIKSQGHLVFPGSLPSKYYPSPTLLNFGDLTRTGAFNVVWSLARIQELSGQT